MNNLHHNSNDCQMIIDTLPIAICMIDQQGIVQYTNQAFEHNMGRGFLEGDKKGPGDLMACVNSLSAPDGCGSGEACGECRLRQYINSCLRGHKKDEFVEKQFTLLRDGVEEKRWFEIHIMTDLIERNGMLLISLLDITFYKRNSLKLLQNKKIAEETNRAKSMFLANMSHEIRTPLNGLIGMLELTLLTELNEEQRDNLEVARNCANTLLALINDILDISKVESDKIVLEEKRFDIREMVRKVMEIHTPRVEEKNLELICNIEENVPAIIKGDSLRLQQILNNLISNAVKFTDKGSVQIEVKVLCKSSDSYTITFTVEDTGVGIAQKDLKYLFQLFSQIDGSFTRRYGGTGLGLAISQKLVNLMGGEIKVKSQKDKGSLFYFTIQMKTADEADAEEEKRLCIDDSVKAARILLVEDDKTNQLVLVKILNQLGYHRIDIANNGYQALGKFENNQYDLILMDIELPQMDGVETTRIIREKEKGGSSHIPIIAVTAFALEGDKERFLAKGMDAYVSKPVDMILLKAELDRFGESGRIKEEKKPDEVCAAWIHESQMKPENKILTGDDRIAFREIMEEMNSAIEDAGKDKAYFVVIEKRAHELKMKARKKEYRKLETGAFRMELAARKSDLAGISRLYADLERVVNQQK